MRQLRSKDFSLNDERLAILENVPDLGVEAHRDPVESSVEASPTKPESLRVVVVAVVVTVRVVLGFVDDQHVVLGRVMHGDVSYGIF